MTEIKPPPTTGLAALGLTRTMVAYASEGITDPDDPTRHMVAYVVPNEPGYYATTYTGTLDYCRTVADNINADLGRADADVSAAVSSSIAAQNRRGDR